MKVFLTSSVSHLQKPLQKEGVKFGKTESYTFADGEQGYRLKNEVQGESIGIIGSILPDPHSLFELMALHHLARENGAGETI